MTANSTSFNSETGAAAGKVGTAFKPEFVEQARKLAALGHTDYEMAEFFEVTERTLRRWKGMHPDFADALKVGKNVADDRVEMSLYRKATGYSYASEKLFCDKGIVVRAETIEHVPPSDTACIFWLKNRRKEEWRDKVDHEHTGKDGAAIETNVNLSGLNDEQLRALASIPLPGE